MSHDQAFVTLEQLMGWAAASRIMRFLWSDAVRPYYEWSRSRILADHLDPHDRAEAALRNGMIGFDGRALVGRAKESDQGIHLSFPGGATIGRTSVLCRIDNSLIMLDVGRDPTGRTPDWTPEVDNLDGVVISHAHHDHLGGLFRLYCDWRYDGPWYGHRDMETIARLALEDSLKLMGTDGSACPYSFEDLEAMFQHFTPLLPRKPLELANGLRITAFDAGHVTGSAQVLLEGASGNLVYSGDFNTRPSSASPELDMIPDELAHRVNVLVVEGTNAFRKEAIVSDGDGREQLLAHIDREQTRPILIPVLSLGRAQDIIGILSETDHKVGVFGLAARMTNACSMSYGENVKLEHRRAEDIPPDEYDILVASAGSLQGGPSAAFLGRSDLRPLPVLLTGFVFPGTPAASGQFPRVRFSGHARHPDWTRYIDHFPNARKFLIHYPGSRSLELPDGMEIPSSSRSYHIGKGGLSGGH